MTDKLLVQVVIEGQKGGSGSGNFGHSGRPGKLGGSIPKGAGGGAGAIGVDVVSQTLEDRLAKVSRLPDGRYNGRELGEQGLYGVNKGYIPHVGDDIDYYDRVGDKVQGAVVSIDRSTVTIKRTGAATVSHFTMVDVKTGTPVKANEPAIKPTPPPASAFLNVPESKTSPAKMRAQNNATKFTPIQSQLRNGMESGSEFAKPHTLIHNDVKFTGISGHPRAQVQQLRRMAQSALNKGDNKRAKAATEIMKALNDEFNLGY